MFRHTTNRHQTQLLSSFCGTKRRSRWHNHHHQSVNNIAHPLNNNYYHHVGSTMTRAAFGSSSSSGTIPPITMPSRPTKSWESGARRVKDTTVQNQYLEHIRDMHDPSRHIKTIEDELKGTIGKALGKQGQKVMMYMRLMEEQRQRYEQLIMEEDRCRHHDVDDDVVTRTTTKNGAAKNTTTASIQECVKQHNNYRKDCIHARWELIVHRQAVGFIVGNHQYVTSTFPIGDALPEWDDESSDGTTTSSIRPDENITSTQAPPTKKKVFGDQLDWWQKIGRWK